MANEHKCTSISFFPSMQGPFANQDKRVKAKYIKLIAIADSLSYICWLIRHEYSINHQDDRVPPRCHAGLETIYSHRKENRIYRFTTEGWVRHDRFWKLCFAKSHTTDVRHKRCGSSIGPAGTKTKLLAIVANVREPRRQVLMIKYNTWVSPFQYRKHFSKEILIHRSKSLWGGLKRYKNLCVKTGKQLVIYISMAFGNPYDDPYDEEIVF